METQVPDINTPSKPIISKSPQTFSKKPTLVPSIFPPFTTHLAQKMATRYAPLALPTQLHNLPQTYAQRIKSFGNEEDVTTQQHLDKFTDFIDLEEVDHEDAIMRLFSQSFTREVKKWFRPLVPRSIQDWEQLQELFLEKWEFGETTTWILKHNIFYYINEVFICRLS